MDALDKMKLRLENREGRMGAALPALYNNAYLLKIQVTVCQGQQYRSFILS